MKKTTVFILTLAFILVLSSAGFSQYTKENSYLSIGAGMNSDAPVFFGSFEKGLKDNISLGGIVGYYGYSEEFNLAILGNYEWSYTYVFFGGTVCYHHKMGNEKIDPYVAVNFVYESASASFSSDQVDESLVTEPSIGGIAFGGSVGIRYYFSPKMAFNLRGGFGFSLFDIGLTFKM